MSALDPLAIPLRGTVLVEASAGTGKTFTLCNLYLRLVVEAERQVGQILVVTYTHAATAELRSRIRDRLRAALLALRDGLAPDADSFLQSFVAMRRSQGAAPHDARLLEVALRSFDEAAIFTIHGFCQRMLLENAFESSSTFDTELVADQYPLCRELVEDHWVRLLHDAPAVLVGYLSDKNSLASIDQLTDLVAKVIAHPDVPVLPERPPELPLEELEQALAARRTAFRACATLWHENRDPLAALLTGSPALKRSAYPLPAVAEIWIPDLDAFFADRSGEAPLFERLERLRPAALRSGVKKGQAAPEHPFFDACENLFEADAALRNCLAECALRFRLALVTWVRSEVRRRHEAANTQSFDDLLHRLRNALRRPSGSALAERLRERFPAALVDEFQDTDPVQYEILRVLYRDAAGPLLLIGDPKQAIYAFRGADIFAYLRARHDAGDAPHTLETNHRSDPDLVMALNALFGRARLPFLVDGIPFVPLRPAQPTARLQDPSGVVPAALELLFLPREGRAGPRGAITKETANEEVPRFVAAEIARLLASDLRIEGRPLRPGDVAVLCRTNLQARQIQGELRALDIPSVRQGDDSVFDADEAEDLAQVLRAVAEPGDAARLRRALVTRTMGLDATALHELGSDEDAWDRWAARFRSWHDVWTTSGFMAAFRLLLEECQVAPRLLAEEGGERALTNLLHLAELLQAEAISAHRGPLALVDWLVAMRADPELRDHTREAAEVRLESDALAVQLTTVHRAKGLEYGVVYCPFLWDGTRLSPSDKRWVRFHADDPERTLCIDIAAADDPEHQARLSLSEREALAEGLRLLYVALTRARYRCSIVWGGISGAESSALAYLLHQETAAASVPGERLAERVRERFTILDDRALRSDLAALVAAAEGRIALRNLERSTALPYRTDRRAARPLGYRTLERPLTETLQITSFSALVANRERLGHRAEEGFDHDAQDRSDGASTGEWSAAAASPEADCVRLHDFPAGARIGQLVHDVLEHLDLAADEETIAALVRRRARRHGLPEAALASLAAALCEALATPIGDPAPEATRFRLADLDPTRLRREMTFTLPAAQGPGRPLSAARLAAVFASLGGSRERAYAERLRRLAFPELRGYLTGVVDLVVEHGGRFWVIDYKSNHLGPRPTDYAPAALEEEMLRHHYVLQSHLYVLALHLHLGRHRPDYDCDRHLGGSLYLFLRGMSPRHPPGTGVFFQRPERALLEEMSRLFAASFPAHTPARDRTEPSR